MRTEIYSTDTDSGSVSVIERTGRHEYKHVARIAIGNAPRGAVKFTSDGRGFVSNCAGDTISEIDTRTYKEVARIKVGLAPRGIGLIPGDRFALVSNSGSDTVSIVDLAARKQVGEVQVGRDPRHMAITPDGRAAYVCVWGDHYLSKIDTSELVGSKDPDPAKVVEICRISLGEGVHPYSAAIVPRRTVQYHPLILVANTQSPLLSVVNHELDQVVGQVDLRHKGARAIAFDKDGERAFVSVEDTSEIVVVSVAGLDVLGRIPVGPGPRGLAFDPDDSTIYASVFARTDSTSGILDGRPFKPNTLTVVSLGAAPSLRRADLRWDEIPVGKGPCSVSILKR